MATFRTRRTNNGERRFQARVQNHGSKTFTTMKDAKTWAAEKEREKRLGEYHIPEPETFGHLLDAFLARHKPSWRPRTQEMHSQSKQKLYALTTVPVTSVSYALLDDIIGAIAVDAPRSAQMTRDLAVSVLKDAEHRGHRIDRRALTVKKPKYESREGRFLSVEQLYELASFAPELSNLILVAGFTGLRQGELFDLLDSDLDLDAGLLNVRAGKTKAARRTVTLIPQAVKALNAQLLARPPGDLVFPNPDGQRWDRAKLGRIFRPARDAAGLDGVGFHDLRRTYCSLMIAAGVNIRTIAQLLGHEDGGALLLKRYGFLYDDAGRRAADALGDLVAAEAR